LVHLSGLGHINTRHGINIQTEYLGAHKANDKTLQHINNRLEPSDVAFNITPSLMTVE